MDEYNNLIVENEDQIASYYNIRQELDSLGVQFRSYITKPEYLVPFLQPGRLIKIKTTEAEYDWGPVVNFKKITEGRKQEKTNPTKVPARVQVDLLLHVISENDNKDNIPKPCLDSEVIIQGVPE